jgi:hypothetical protein
VQNIKTLKRKRAVDKIFINIEEWCSVCHCGKGLNYRKAEKTI